MPQIPQILAIMVRLLAEISRKHRQSPQAWRVALTLNTPPPLSIPILNFILDMPRVTFLYPFDTSISLNHLENL